MSMPACAKCGSPMENGFVVDYRDGCFTRQSTWIGGAVEPSFWTGTKTRGKPQFGIVTYRCTRCGYLEAYATESAD